MVVPDASILGSQVAVGVLVAWVMWQVYAPQIIGVTTSLSPLFDLPDRINDIEERTDELRSQVTDLDKKQVHHIQVTRANSRALDEERNVTIDSENVDEYLVDNGITIAELTRRQHDAVRDGYSDVNHRGGEYSDRDDGDEYSDDGFMNDSEGVS